MIVHFLGVKEVPITKCCCLLSEFGQNASCKKCMRHTHNRCMMLEGLSQTTCTLERSKHWFLRLVRCKSPASRTHMSLWGVQYIMNIKTILIHFENLECNWVHHHAIACATCLTTAFSNEVPSMPPQRSHSFYRNPNGFCCWEISIMPSGQQAEIFNQPALSLRWITDISKRITTSSRSFMFQEQIPGSECLFDFMNRISLQAMPSLTAASHWLGVMVTPSKRWMVSSRWVASSHHQWAQNRRDPSHSSSDLSLTNGRNVTWQRLRLNPWMPEGSLPLVPRKCKAHQGTITKHVKPIWFI